MKYKMICFLTALLLMLALSASAEIPGETVTITFKITDNSQKAISARIGMEFDVNVFEFVGTAVISPDVLSKAPDTAQSKFGLLNLSGIATGEIGTITLRIKDAAKAGKYEIKPVVDSVYNANRETVELTVVGGTIAVSHVWDDGRITVEATCYSEGVMTYSCLYCNEKRTRVIPITKHREGTSVVTKAAACTEDGEQIYPCDICHDVLRTEIIPATGHADGDVVITQKATCDTPGVQVTQCANCGKTIRSETILASGHTQGEKVTLVEPTDVLPGLARVSCTICGKPLFEEEIPALGISRIAGDADGDGEITINDAILILQYDASMNIINADVTADGKVDIHDALLILQYVAGWNVRFQ